MSTAQVPVTSKVSPDLLGLQDKEGARSRTWLLPLLRQHVANAPLDFWGAHLLPLARYLLQRATAPAASSADRLAAMQCLALEAQIWNTLPSFCNWPTDLEDAFRQPPAPTDFFHHPLLSVSTCMRSCC